MGEEGEKGFIIKDRRSFDQEGRLKDKGEEQEEKKEQKAAAEEKKGRPAEETSKDQEDIPLPEVNFNSLIFSLSSSALLHLGEIADPQTGETKKDLKLAKHTIDTIAMLKEKTEGNLTEEESKFIESVLTDVRWRYVGASKEGGK